MSLFAGVLARQQTETLPEIPAGMRQSLTRLISRSDDPVMEYSVPGFFLVKVDVGAFPTAAWVEPSGPEIPYMATLTGHPFLEDDAGGAENRTVQLRHIAAAVAAGDHGVLRRCQGIFAFCYYDPGRRSLLLAADKLCNRPLYVCVTDEFVFFATALRVLEELPEVPKRMDMQGLAEYLALDYPLADRTVYADVKLLHAAEMLMCEKGAVTRHRYFRWDAVQSTPISVAERVSDAYDLFRTAVQRRCMGEDLIVSMLSGGLDSRCCVSMLRVLSKQVYTVSLLLPGFLDGQLAIEFARVLGLPNVARPTESVVPSAEEFAELQMNLSWPEAKSLPIHTNRIFSGDGGSLGLGHIYIDETQVTLLRQGQRKHVVQHLVSQNALPPRIFRRSVHAILQEAIYHGVADEFNNVQCDDPARDLYLFYLLNDQRRHVYRYFENIDIYRFEHLVPFFDGAFLEAIAGAPVDDFLRHRFYHEWIKRFPPEFCSVPWQVYRGHEPCPVVNRLPGRYQWDKRRGDAFVGLTQQRMWKCARTLFTGQFPRGFMRRAVVAPAWLLHALRIRPCGYVFRLYVYLQSVNAACGGKPAHPTKAWHTNQTERS